MKKIILACLIVLSFACKNEEKKAIETEKPVKKEVVKDNIFRVFINIRVSEDDKFELYYVGDTPDGNFNVNERVAKYIKGSDDFQVVELSLPENIFPYKFRIDLGDNINKYETDIEIKSIIIQLNKEKIEIENELLSSFFQNNVYLEKTPLGYKRKSVDNRYDPFLISTPLLIKKIELEL